MLKYLRPWFWGFLCSYLGSLPLGSTNTITILIKQQEGFNPALLFAIGIALAEIVHVSVTLFSMKWILSNKKLFNAMQWFTIFLFFAMALACFYSVYYPSKAGNVVLEAQVNKFFLGFGISIINIIPIPFWFLWTTVFITKKRINPTVFDYTLYAFGIFIGTVACQICYMFLGGALISFFNASLNSINIIVGIVLLITVIIQLVKKLKGNDLFEKVEKHNAELK